MLKHIRTSTYLLLCAAMLAVLLVSIVLAIHIGAVDLTAEWVFQILVNHLTGREVYPALWPGYADGIVWGMRLPKVIVAACVGGGLSLVGIMMQAMTKNSMADPYLLGISSGASAGATAAILVGSLPLIGAVSVPSGAFIGAMVSSVLVFLIAGAGGQVSSTKLILSGTAISALFSALSNLLIFLQSNEKKLSAVLFWMTGSFASAAWRDVLPVFLSLVVCAALMLLLHKSLDALLLGEELAITVGVDVAKLKLLIVVLSSLVTGVMVSVSGTIGFVGLVIPHIARTIIGTAHRRMLPFAVLLGGILMVWADALARVVVAPSELPIGVVTAFLGAPFFLLLLRGSKYSFQ
ncbi:MAG: iron ABC transporter permease [Oscillospiraceae bacterium]|nr:iron ABC transporter permease [Oscillospiraceae bacterium]